MRAVPAARGDRLWRRLPAAAAWLAGLVAAAVGAFLVASVWPLLAGGGLAATLAGPWRPYAAPASYGIAPMIATSLLLAVGATALAVPAAIGMVAFIAGVGPRLLRRPVLAAVQFMTSIPTVVHGFVAVVVLVPLIRRTFTDGSGFSLLGAMLMVALLILPTIVLIVHAHLSRGDRAGYVACLALGLRPAQALALVVLPAARRSLAAAVTLGFCRALGDTLIALMVAGNAAQAPDSLLDSVRALTAHIALVLATDAFGPEYRSVAAAALVLFVVTAALSLGLRRLGGKDAA
jgi:phosphate transport system permease protein